MHRQGGLCHGQGSTSLWTTCRCPHLLKPAFRVNHSSLRESVCAPKKHRAFLFSSYKAWLRSCPTSSPGAACRQQRSLPSPAQHRLCKDRAHSPVPEGPCGGTVPPALLLEDVPQDDLGPAQDRESPSERRGARQSSVTAPGSTVVLCQRQQSRWAPSLHPAPPPTPSTTRPVSDTLRGDSFFLFVWSSNDTRSTISWAAARAAPPSGSCVAEGSPPRAANPR